MRGLNLYTEAGDWVLADLLPARRSQDPGSGVDLAGLVGEPAGA
jgi:hypothetical protein